MGSAPNRPDEEEEHFQLLRAVLHLRCAPKVPLYFSRMQVCSCSMVVWAPKLCLTRMLSAVWNSVERYCKSVHCISTEERYDRVVVLLRYGSSRAMILVVLPSSFLGEQGSYSYSSHVVTCRHVAQG